MQCNKCSDGGGASRELWGPEDGHQNLGSGVRRTSGGGDNQIETEST